MCVRLARVRVVGMPPVGVRPAFTGEARVYHSWIEVMAGPMLQVVRGVCCQHSWGEQVKIRAAQRVACQEVDFLVLARERRCCDQRRLA